MDSELGLSHFTSTTRHVTERHAEPHRFTIVLLLAAAALLLGIGKVRAQAPFQAVNLLLGTANGGQTIPSIGMPFAMTNWTPETRSTEKKCVAPYYFKDRQMTGFRGSHWMSGSCSQDYGSVTLMPVTGSIDVTPAGRASSFRHQSETMTPAYYSVVLDRYAERVEMTGATRSGMFRITAPAGAELSVLIEPNSKPNEGFVEIDPKRREILGYNPVHRIYLGTGQSAGFSGYFVARFEQPFRKYGTWCGARIRAGADRQKGGCDRLGAYATFPAAKTPLLVKIGTSFTSLEEAARNLDAEESGWDFNGVEVKTEAAWKQRLKRIAIQGATPDERRTFYSALYHASLVPRIASDADGTYNGFAQQGKLHKVRGGAYYGDFSVWDTFRALHPLLAIIDPDRDQEMIRSLLLKGEQGGDLPSFPLWNSYTAEMVGDHTVALIADAYVKGLTHFDVAEAYRLVLKNATVTPPLAEYKLGRGRRALPSYLKYGFIPLEDPVTYAFHHNEQVSRTLEYAYDDSLVAILARRLGKPSEAAMMQKRSENWRNVIDPGTGFARGRHSDGSWVEPFDPTAPASYITEGVPWQYTFFVPQNVPGLIQVLGGRQKFIAKLDGLFAHHLDNQGNEPSHHIPYLYDYAQAPWKTQQHVRAILQSQYRNGPEGLPGNDDAGQMSAWYIFGAMGFYPVCPGTAVYAIGSPLLPRVSIHLANGKDFVIVANHNSEKNIYIQSAMLNGKPLDRPWFTHRDIAKGGQLVFNMGPAPNKLWGSAPHSIPPSR
ncbi:MAG TPA: GH92 family glycosyl hydrolase [Terriglobia bacterium]|nr:GH92 family glycosyl hydrolase [Terriglobia bacterium]